MPFSNEAVGGQTLVRAQIKSPNYVPGVSGWAIKRDGSAEFNTLLLRGSWEVDAPVPLTKVKGYTDANGFSVIEFMDQDGDKYTITAFPTVNALSIFAGDTASSVSELAFAKGGYIRFNSASSIAFSGIVFDYLSGYLKSYNSPTIETWNAAVLQNGWTNFGGGYAPLQYRMLPHGYVGLEGTIQPGTTVDGTTVTTLPYPYRPLYVTRRVPISEKGIAMMADIQPDGQVKVIGTAGATTVSFQVTFPTIDV